MEVVLKLFQEGTLFFWWMCYALTIWDFEGNAIVLGYWSNDARKKERKKVKDVLSKYPDMPLPPPPFFLFFFPTKCVCPLLLWNRTFQEQPSLSKLALKAAGQAPAWFSVSVHLCIRRWAATVCHKVSYFKYMNERMTAKWVTPSCHIDSTQDSGTERVIVSFTLTQNNQHMMDNSLQRCGEVRGLDTLRRRRPWKPNRQVSKMGPFLSTQRTPQNNLLFF